MLETGNESLVGWLHRDAEVACANLEQSVRFFSEILGLPIIARNSTSARLDGGAGRWLTLWRTSPLDMAEMSGAEHQTGVTFEVGDLYATYNDLLAQGLEFSSLPCRQPWGHVMVNLIDPDRNRIMLVQRRQAARDWRHAPLLGDSAAA
jgi:catechol 2,3-dioxygenase-like lactoylglutathione lyase family enzyme